jgi:hypothetical protein
MHATAHGRQAVFINGLGDPRLRCRKLSFERLNDHSSQPRQRQTQQSSHHLKSASNAKDVFNKGKLQRLAPSVGKHPEFAW